METLEQRIKRLREARQLSQQQLADQLKVSRVAVTKWESGQTANMKIENLLAMSALFGVSIDELVTGRRPVGALSVDEQSLLASWRSAAQSVQQAVRLMLAPQRLREALDGETRLALRLLELAAPAALMQSDRLAA